MSGEMNGQVALELLHAIREYGPLALRDLTTEERQVARALNDEGHVDIVLGRVCRAGALRRVQS